MLSVQDSGGRDVVEGPDKWEEGGGDTSRTRFVDSGEWLYGRNGGSISGTEREMVCGE